MSEKPPKAVAVQYKRGQDSAPRVTAKGQGSIAEKILSLARQKGVQIHKDSALVEALYRLDINQEIPEDLYQVLAEVLAFVYEMNRLRGGQQG
ncbi:MAG: EscU/YscU/HrcU family type III secretion system export apparatus switch protein [Thermodesulfobacteriota bacterium]|nr:EscU/YscU/HrcU family type III secretion system export apparatus switch protein [Thermodesulfobacteriota bacterium]